MTTRSLSLFLTLTIPSMALALEFFPLPPCRVVDTRLIIGPLGGPSLPAGLSRTFPVPQSPCGSPSNAQALSLNITVVPLSPSLGFLAVYPTGRPRPTVSTLNSLQGQVIANAAIVMTGLGGSIDIFVSHPTHVVIDINGYFAPGLVSLAGPLLGEWLSQKDQDHWCFLSKSPKSNLRVWVYSTLGTGETGTTKIEELTNPPQDPDSCLILPTDPSKSRSYVTATFTTLTPTP